MIALLLAALLVPTHAHAKEEMERASTKKALVPGSAEAVEEAVKRFEKAVELADQGRIARAISVLEEAVGLAPAAPGPRRKLGEFYFQIADCSQAIRHLTDYMKMGAEKADEADKMLNKCAKSKKLQGKVNISASPDEAVIKLVPPGRDTAALSGRGAAAGPVPSGSYTLRITHPGFRAVESALRVLPMQTLEVAESLEPSPAILSINSQPPGATVLLDGVERGKTPLRIEPVDPGDHEVKAILERHVDATSKVRIDAGQVVELGLNPTPKPAAMKVTSTPPGVAVAVGGVPRCSTPCKLDLEAGRSHPLLLSGPGLLSQERAVTPTPGEEGALAFEMAQTPETIAGEGRRLWGMARMATGLVLAGVGGYLMTQSFDSADEADHTYRRYLTAETASEAATLYDKAESLDGQAYQKQLVGGGVAGAGVGLGLWGAWMWVTAP